MAIEPEELKAVIDGVTGKHRSEVIELVSMFNTVFTMTASNPLVQIVTLMTLKLCINARLREIHGNMAEFEACAHAMAQAGVTLDVLSKVGD